MKKKIISILMSTISAKTNERIKNEQIFNLFLRMKRSKTEEENSIIKYMVFKKENFFLKIDEIKNKNKGKKQETNHWNS